MPVQAKTTKKTAFVFFAFSERAVRLAYSGLIILLMLASPCFEVGKAIVLSFVRQKA